MVHRRRRCGASGTDSVQFDFMFKGVRYRPSIKRPPSEANLRRARERLEAIKQQIRFGTFSFEEEFPDYRFLPRVSGTSNTRLCNEVFDAYVAHCEARLQRGDMAGVTVTGPETRSFGHFKGRNQHFAKRD
jgi:hypothetical protein